MEPTAEQHAAIRAQARRRAIIAHPGTGKTFTLVRIIEDLVSRRRRERDCITAVTFTRAAARELERRVGELLGDGRARGITFGTSHALALRVLRQHHAYYGLPARITVYDDVDQRDVIQDTARLLGMRVTVNEVLQALDEQRARMPGETRAQAKRVAEEYDVRLRRAGAVDYAQLLPYAISGLRADATIRQTWTRRARYLIVDEYQDVAPLELELYGALQPREVTVVGDPNQEIYRFRGTTNRYLMEAAASADWRGALTQSFRSGSAVVRAARDLIAHNPDQPPEVLQPQPGVAGRVVHAALRDWEDHDRRLVRAARLALDEGQSVAVLHRTNRGVARAEEALQAKSVPTFRITSDRAWYAREEVRTYHAHVRAAYNLRDDVATRLVLTACDEAPEPGSLRWYEARRESIATDRPLLEILGWWGCGLTSLEAVASRAASVLRVRYQEQGRTTKARHVDLAHERLMRWAEREPERASLESFVDWLQSRDLADAVTMRPDAPVVDLATYHGAKGLEWDTVILPDYHQGVVPHARASVEEERRLAYVALTRARLRVLVLTSAESGREPSAFIREAHV